MEKSQSSSPSGSGQDRPADPRQRQSTAVVTQTSSPYWADMLDMTIRRLDDDIISRLSHYWWLILNTI